ncbi:hypothetical protein [Spirosoma pollinicola]|uniref:Uncharacterized protein n=1 Tax=Spirosoma pollinicola TaxID=2057025 RepID=A0A2K8YW37_9BACT|nr:hypothetical protein [Spirosoma pollinicola]AUD01813.1 hypothetical protein CWM47_08260 [Spirosoma pollinicola]
MAKAAAKRIAIQLEELIDKVDLSALPSDEQDKFKVWMAKSTSMQVTIETALRRGHVVKAYLNSYRKQTEYWVKIEDPRH